jgi:hypothetical protein
VTRFDRAQLVAFIRAIDRNLTERVEVLVVGGAAATVGYDSGVRTADIDIFRVLKGSSDALVRAADLARQETGLGVSVAAAAVADLPTTTRPACGPSAAFSSRT